jgi:predicted transcriptional regulator
MSRVFMTANRLPVRVRCTGAAALGSRPAVPAICRVPGLEEAEAAMARVVPPLLAPAPQRISPRSGRPPPERTGRGSPNAARELSKIKARPGEARRRRHSAPARPAPLTDLTRAVVLGHTVGMKVAISVPDDTFEAAERMARRLRMSRSQLYARAVEAYVGAQRGSEVREKLAAVYGSTATTVDPVIDQLQAEALREEW